MAFKQIKGDTPVKNVEVSSSWYLVAPWHKKLFFNCRNADDHLCLGHWNLWFKLRIVGLIHKHSKKCREPVFYYSDGTN